LSEARRTLETCETFHKVIYGYYTSIDYIFHRVTGWSDRSKEAVRAVLILTMVQRAPLWIGRGLAYPRNDGPIYMIYGAWDMRYERARGGESFCRRDLPERAADDTGVPRAPIYDICLKCHFKVLAVPMGGR
jgi:hypothetical protein